MSRSGVFRSVAALLLLLAAGGKLVSGHRPEFSLGPSGYWAITVCEFVLAFGFMGSTTWRVTAYLAVLGAFAASLFAIFGPSQPKCGCMGDVVMSRAMRVGVASVLGLLSSLALSTGSSPDCRLPALGETRADSAHP
jgi:hypothetical protein